MTAFREPTDPMLRALPAHRNRRRMTWWQVVLAIAGGVVAVSQAAEALTGAGVLSAPWESRQEATEAHTRLQQSLDELREEQRKNHGAVIEAVNKVGDQLGQRRRPR